MRALMIAALASALLAGCASEPVKTEEEMRLLTEQNNVVANAYREGRGFDQLTPEEKERFMKGFNGDEAKARKAFEKAAEGMAYFFGGGNRPSPAPSGTK
ncbi:MAG: hypothetical protein N2109_08225 [Fimbriimonadales bacterium]|nr:hypothetical protein [Fimbriimonadales bacterium]